MSSAFAPDASFPSQDLYSPPSANPHAHAAAAGAYATPPASVQSMDARSSVDYHAHPDLAVSSATSVAPSAAYHAPNTSDSAKYPQPDYATFARGGYPDGSSRYPPQHPPPPAQQQQQQQPHHQPAQTSAPAVPGNMAQSQNPNIAASSPTYPQQQHYEQQPYHQQPMPHYQNSPAGYPPRPEHGYGYPVPHGIPSPYGHVPTSMATPPSMVPAGTRPGVSLDEQFQRTNSHMTQGGHPLSTVYSFVPIPGTHQQKRPRRRYEEIERMYKCGWNGCEKAYGTLNHLNAHVTMQSHGSKRTPEEFKEIRKEWKARKKEEDNQRKAEEERHRQAAQQAGADGQQPPDGQANGAQSQYPPQVRQLPPLGYAPAGGQVGGQYPQPGTMSESMPQYSNGHMPYSYPQSPYGQNQMYHQQHPTVPGQTEATSGQ